MSLNQIHITNVRVALAAIIYFLINFGIMIMTELWITQQKNKEPIPLINSDDNVSRTFAYINSSLLAVVIAALHAVTH